MAMDDRHRLNRYFARDPRSLRRRTEPLPEQRSGRVMMLVEGLLEEAPFIGSYMRRRRQRTRFDAWQPLAPPLPGDLETPHYLYAWLVLIPSLALLFVEPFWALIMIVGAVAWYLRTLFSPQQLARRAFEHGVEALTAEETPPPGTVTAFERALEHRPRTYELGKHLAIAQAMTGDWAAAVQIAADYLTIFEVDLGARTLLADGLLRLGRVREARDTLEKALAFHPEAADELAIINQRAEILLALGEPGEALTLLRLHHPRFVPDPGDGPQLELTPEEVAHHRLRASALRALDEEAAAAAHEQLVQRYSQG